MDIMNLLDKLDQFSSWRKRELSQAKFLAVNAKNKEAQRYLCRAWVIIMYAHCDYFLKECTKTYLEYLKINFKDIKNYKYELIWLVFSGKDKTFKAKDQNYKSLIDYSGSNESLYFDEHLINNIIKLGNFKYQLLRYYCDWIMQIKLNHSELRFFCKNLQNMRNKIAHGEEYYIEQPDDCFDLHTKTINFIDSLKEAIIENAKENT